MATQSRRPRLFYNDAMSAHTHEWPHIERASRAVEAYEHLTQCGLIERCEVLPGRHATDEELLTTHTERHLEEVQRMTAAAALDPSNRALREPDGPGGVYYSPAAESSARLACGCVIDAALDVINAAAEAPSGVKEPTPVSFALVRPPGHHAGADDTPGHRAEGFCFFNSVAVAANVALERGAAKKVCIVDWDVHHGNGTQNIFYQDGRVLYVSLHRFGDRWYPETGALDEVGEGGGIGANVNIPWTVDGMTDTDYLAALSLVVLPIISSFSPDLLLISAGFDAADGDAQGRMRVTPAGFATMTTLLMQAAQCPTSAALEGGYNSRVTSECCAATLRALMGEVVEVPTAQLLNRTCEHTLRAVVAVQAPHHPLLLKGSLDVFFAEVRCASFEARGVPHARRRGRPSRVIGPAPPDPST